MLLDVYSDIWLQVNELGVVNVGIKISINN